MVKVKVKVTLVQTLRFCTGRTAYRGSRGIALLFHDHGTRRAWGVSLTPRPLFTPGKDPVPIVQWLDGPQGRSGQLRKISPPQPRFDPRAVQSVASRYTDWNIPARALYVANWKILFDAAVCLYMALLWEYRTTSRPLPIFCAVLT